MKRTPKAQIPAIDMHTMFWASQHRGAIRNVFFAAVTWVGSLVAAFLNSVIPRVKRA